jgi:hypothetical protein
MQRCRFNYSIQPRCRETTSKRPRHRLVKSKSHGWAAHLCRSVDGRRENKIVVLVMNRKVQPSRAIVQNDPCRIMPAKAGNGSLPIYDVPKRKEESVFGIYAWAVS